MAEKKTMNMYTTKSGAKQSGKPEDIKKHAERAFRRFIASPTNENLQILRTFDAAHYARIAKEFRELDGTKQENVFDKLEKANLTERQKSKARSLLRANK